MSKLTPRARAMGWLAQREHSALEISNKLTKAGFDAAVSADVLAQLIDDDLQSDQRFAEAYIHSRSQRGFGWQKIQFELQQRGVAAFIVSSTLAEMKIDWFTLALKARHKRFGEQIPREREERAKQQRFLYYRGFTHEQINGSFE